MFSSSNYLVSFIIPTYNSSKFLPDLFLSLLEQTNSNFEVVFVDDGSCDNTIELLENFKNNKSYVSIFKSQHIGPFYARQKGFEISSGEYVYFVDSDDIIAPFFIEMVCDAVIKYKSPDIIKILVTDFFNEKPIFSLSDNYTYIQGTDNVIDILINTYFCKGMYLNVFKRSVVNYDFSLKRCVDYCIGEDLLATYSFVKQSNTLLITNNVVYGYRQNPSSLMHNRGSINDELGFLEVLEYVMKDITQRKINISQHIWNSVNSEFITFFDFVVCQSNYHGFLVKQKSISSTWLYSYFINQYSADYQTNIYYKIQNQFLSHNCFFPFFIFAKIRNIFRKVRKK